MPGMPGNTSILKYLQQHTTYNHKESKKKQKAGPLAIIQAAWLEPQYGLRWSRYTFWLKKRLLLSFLLFLSLNPFFIKKKQNSFIMKVSSPSEVLPGIKIN